MTPRDLKEQFKIETGRSIINDKGCHDIDYVHWLEDKIVKNCFIPDVIKSVCPACQKEGYKPNTYCCPHCGYTTVGQTVL